MSGSLIPNAKQQYFDANGNPLAGGFVYYYIPGTTTFKNTYQDAGLTILNTNPIILDSAGECITYGDGSYRQIVTDVNGNLIWDQTTVSPITLTDVGSVYSASNGSSLIGYNEGASGAVNRTVQSKLQEIISIKDFGAKGDGTTDDTSAIQAAINSGNYYIYLPDGTYKITANLLISQNNLTLYGPGVINIGANDLYAIKITGNNNVINRLRITNTGNYTLTNPAIFPKAAGIFITGSFNTVNECQIENVVNGVLIYGNMGASNAYNNRVTNNQISVLPFNYGTYIGWPNDGVLSFYATETTIQNNIIAVFTSYNNFIVSGTAYTYARGAIICDANSENNSIIGNTCGQGFLATVHNEAGSYNVIQNNKVYQGYYSSIVGGSARIEYNQIIGPAYVSSISPIFNAAITVVGNSIVNGNTISCSDALVSAIQLQTNASNFRIINNTISGTYLAGVKGNYLADLFIQSNNFIGTMTYGIYVGCVSPETGRTEISNNTIASGFTNFIYGNPLMNASINGNIAQGSVGDVVYCAGDSNNLIINGNDFSGGTAGVYSVHFVFNSANHWSCITGNNFAGKTTAVGIVYSDFVTHQIVTANINNTTAAL